MKKSTRKLLNMKKSQILQHWSAIPENQSLKPSPVPYKHKGSTYAEDGIRVTGSRQFIDSVLSRLKDLLRFENSSTRLQVVYKESRDRETGIPLESFNFYIQVHERGQNHFTYDEIAGPPDKFYDPDEYCHAMKEEIAKWEEENLDHIQEVHTAQKNSSLPKQSQQPMPGE